jgi:hypothetical protein
MVQVLDAEMHSDSTPTKYGAVKSGQLKLRGFLTSAIWTRLNYTDEKDRTGELYADQGDHSTQYWDMSICPDALEIDLWDTNLYSINVYLLVLLVDKNVERATGIILRKHKDGVYSRLGVFHCPSTQSGVENYPNEACKFLQGPEEMVTIK